MLINNPNDNLCAPRNIIAALTYHTNNILDGELNKNDITYIRKGRNIQKKLAIELCNKIMHDPEEPFDLTDIVKVENYLKNVRIRIVCYDFSNNIIYEGIGERD